MGKVKKYALMGAGMFVFSFILGGVILPTVVKMEVKKKAALKPGWEMRAVWSKFPFSMDLCFNFFNVTNPDEISGGAKPRLQEVGPFCYFQWQEKTNQVDHEEDDTVSYTFRNTYYFNPEKSNGLTAQEEIIVPNILALGLVNVVLKERPTAMPIISKAVNSIFKNPESLFMKIKVNDLLFEGFVIDCDVKDTAGVAVCKEIKENAEKFGMPVVAPNKYLFSLWGTKNATDAKERVRVYRGYKNLMNVGTVVEYNNKPNISVWDDEVCDKFQGTDGTIFHPFFDKNGQDNMVAFNGGLCRSVVCHMESKSKYKDGANNPEHKCYCEEPDHCLKKGVFDAFKCLGLPIIFSNPHFYLADPYYLNAVEGLKPIKEKHMIRIELEPNVGAPVRASAKAQANFFIAPVQKFKLMKTFPEALLPVFWIQEDIELPDDIFKELKDGVKQMEMGAMFKNLMTFGGLGLCCYAGFLYYQSTQGGNQAEDVNNNKKSMQPPESGNSSTYSTKPNSAGGEIDMKKVMQMGNMHPAPIPAMID